MPVGIAADNEIVVELTLKKRTSTPSAVTSKTFYFSTSAWTDEDGTGGFF